MSKATKKTVKTAKRKLLSPEQRSAISRKAAFAAHKTMQSAPYKRAKKVSRSAVNKFLANRA